MSTRIPQKHPEERKQKKDKHKSLPNMTKAGVVQNILQDQDKKRVQIHSSIAHRMQYLQNNRMANRRNEIERLKNFMQAGPITHASDARYGFVPLREQGRIRSRMVQLGIQNRNEEPIIGPTGHYQHAFH